MEEEITWGLEANFLAAPNQPFFSLAAVDTINVALVGWDLLDPSQEKMNTSKKWTPNSQLFLGHVCVKWMQKQNTKLSLTLCGSVWWDHSPPEIEMFPNFITWWNASSSSSFMLLEAGIFKGNTELSVSFQVPSLVPQASPADQTGATAGAGD